MSEDGSAGPSRRRYLASVAVTVGGGTLAGCTSAEETPPGVGQIDVQNRLGRPIEASITHRQDGEQNETTVSLAADPDEGPLSQTVVEPWMGDHGDWELRIDASGVEAEQYTSESFDERFYDYNETDCLLLSVRIDDGISITPRTVAVDCP
jgi:hypothetical protein